MNHNSRSKLCFIAANLFEVLILKFTFTATYCPRAVSFMLVLQPPLEL